MISFIPVERRGVVSKVAPEYALKGAARVAREHYPDPNYIPPTEAISLFRQLGCDAAGNVDDKDAPPGRLSEHPEGRALLQYMVEYGTFLHNKMGRTRDAVRIFEAMLRYDGVDSLVSELSSPTCV